MSVFRERFDSTERLCRFVETAPVNEGWENHIRESRTGDKEFTGTNSIEEAVAFARNGWNDPVANMKELTRSKLLSAAERIGLKPSRPINAYVGGSPNVARAIIGLPRDMRRVSFEEKKLPGMTLVYEAGVLAWTSAQEVEEHGTRFLALVNVLEASGVPTRVVCSSACKSHEDDNIYACEVVIKDFGNALNIKKAAFFLANASFQRRLVFSWRESTPLIKHHLSGYGQSVNSDDRTRRQFREYASEHGERWFSFNDFESDDDIIRKYEELKRR